MTAAVLYAPDGYDIERPGVMGRQSAGAGFLRALVAGREGEPVRGYGVASHRAAFEAAVSGLDPLAPPLWANLGAINPGFATVYHRPDPIIEFDARLRLRAGPAAYSLTGITHTLSTPGMMDAIAAMVTAPLTPWDALVCTSAAGAEVVRRIQDAQTDYLHWKLGAAAIIGPPQIRVIPLGVHTADFEFSNAERAEARAGMGLSADDVLALYVGRRTFAAKAHPQAMYQALQTATVRTGVQVVLAECGQAPNESIRKAHDAAALQFAPGVRHLTPGGDPVELRKCWAAADVFVSLADNRQETFGLTPLEAMAAGVPVVVTDWNGYRETVRPDIDGFLIPTWAPPDGAGEEIARALECGLVTIDRGAWAATSATSVEIGPLIDALSALIGSPELRRRMGAAGRERAKSTFDWGQVLKSYRGLWAELSGRRLAALPDASERAWIEAAPKASPSRHDPFRTFGHYPTHQIGPETVVTLAQGAELATFQALRILPLWSSIYAPEPSVAAYLARLGRGPATAAELAAISSREAFMVLGTLAKMGLISLSADHQGFASL